MHTLQRNKSIVGFAKSSSRHAAKRCAYAPLPKRCKGVEGLAVIAHHFPWLVEQIRIEKVTSHTHGSQRREELVVTDHGDGVVQAVAKEGGGAGGLDDMLQRRDAAIGREADKAAAQGLQFS